MTTNHDGKTSSGLIQLPNQPGLAQLAKVASFLARWASTCVIITLDSSLTLEVLLSLA
jgi:hypothetical protein